MSKSNFKPVKNAQTGVIEYQFGAILTGINTKSPQKYTNGDGVEKVYYLGTIDFTAPNGVEQKGATTQIHAKSFDHGMKVGDNLLSTLTRDDAGNLWVRTSHLMAISTLDVAAFAGLTFDEIEEVVATTAPTVEATA